MSRTDGHRMDGAIRIVVACAAVGIALVPTAAHATINAGSVQPERDSFYSAPADIACYHSGDVVAARPVAMRLSVPVRAWQLSYRTDDSQNQPELAITTVIVPTAAWTGPGTRPAVSIQVAEDSTGTQCAPSYTLLSSSRSNRQLNPVLQRNWAVSVPDYEGPRSAWMAGGQAGHAVLDGMRAAQQFQPAALGPDTRWGLSGYSGGVHATGWAAQLQRSYAPQLQAVGAAIGGTPGDLNALVPLGGRQPAVRLRIRRHGRTARRIPCAGPEFAAQCARP